MASSPTPGASDSELQERCTKAETKVTELDEENGLLKEINEAQSQMLDAQDRAVQEKKETTATSTTLGPMSFPTLSGKESGLMPQTSPHLEGGLSGLSMPRASPLPRVGRGAVVYFSGPVTSPSDSTPFPSPRVGAGGAVCFHQAIIWGHPA